MECFPFSLTLAVGKALAWEQEAWVGFLVLQGTSV